MSSWRSGRGLQWQPVKLWWTPCQRGLRQCWKIMVVTQNIDTLGPIWTFSFRGALTFVASSLDINGCVLSYFERTADLHCYTCWTLTAFHLRKVSYAYKAAFICSEVNAAYFFYIRKEIFLQFNSKMLICFSREFFYYLTMSRKVVLLHIFVETTIPFSWFDENKVQKNSIFLNRNLLY